MRTISYLVASMVAAIAFMASLEPAAAAPSEPVVQYEGILQDASGKPIGGVYPLTFALYQRSKGGKPVFSETHFVAVEAGVYVVELGKKRRIPRSAKLDRLFVSVSITDGNELVREPLDPSTVVYGDDSKPTRAPTTKPTRTTKVSPSTTVEYAETAGRAYIADTAKSADKLGKLTEKAINEKLSKTGSKPTIATKTRFSPPAGGDGGTPYEVRCPPGYFVTGVKGHSGIYLDSVQLICSTFEK